MASPHFVDLLCDHVDNVTDYKSFIPIMKAMAFDIEELRCVIKWKIRTLNETAARKVAFNAMPIDSSLPMDTIQHILSFNDFNDCKNVKFVCESFKKSFERNQELIHRSRKRIVAENANHFSPDVPFDESIGKIYVLRPAGEPLVERIKALGDEVVVHDDLMRCLIDLEGSTGARIFVQNGRYEIELLEDGLDISIESQNLQIIGIGEKVEICFHDRNPDGYDCAFAIGGDSKVLFENIAFIFTRPMYESASTGTTIGVSGESIIWMDRCNLGFTTYNVDLARNARAYFKSCQFASSESAIINTGGRNTARVTILDSVFSGELRSGCVYTDKPVICIGSVVYGGSCLFYRFAKKQVKDQSLLQGNLNIRDGIAMKINEY